MHILVIGASGRNGQLVVAEALAREHPAHTVTALVRRTSPFPHHHHDERLTVVRGTPLDATAVHEALHASPAAPLPDAIVIALSQRRASDSPFARMSPDASPTLMADALRTILRVVQQTQQQQQQQQQQWRPKLVVNSSQGVGDSWASMTAPVRWLFRWSNMRIALRDHAEVDGLVRSSGLDFVLARPPRLVDGPPPPPPPPPREQQQRHEHGPRHGPRLTVLPDNGEGCGWNPTATRAGLAAWMVDAVEVSTWDGRAPVVIDT
ncbi:NAD(P)-binding domain protein [Moelleriella libera RCEF 2490]|uniref:NAD(P)-binding domain protein n=1 Tax=Moelleriella libera RCEF 2490 TaxID=1081109 RepID=A0A166UKQ4_9HYPO|nr:NAD(P)-binding domain protein [Moelleriella libera RCEF 2490]